MALYPLWHPGASRPVNYRSYLIFTVLADHGYSIWAAFLALTDPERYYLDQIPGSSTAGLTKIVLDANGLALTLQMGNIFILLISIAVICTHTTHVDVAKKYLLVIALGDLGHIWASAYALGDVFWDVGRWNDMAWGNIGSSAFLHVNRLATVAGLFGTIGVAKRAGGKRD